ncbi:MAG: insulinase family protein [Tannerella sp.]|nr:insulinase family protein [Tannerella sp.]
MKRKLLISIFLTCLICVAYGQNTDKKTAESGSAPKIEKLIIDPKVRYGRLDNGMTYYIRHNETSKERAEFYLVHHIGSLQEEEHQRGLTHFLERMTFYGSKNFPSKTGILDYTKSIGLKMGENLNVSTGFDQTVYKLINVPVTKKGVIDSCLLILHDWSGFLSLTDESIEKERGVIREELRTGNSAQTRLWKQQLPKLFPNCKYGNRLPIGSAGVINNFTGKELRDYYKKWYRPDLQAVIITGDIDVDKIDAKIKTMYADILPPKDEISVVEALVADNTIPVVSIAKDKEMTGMELSIMYKHDALPSMLRGTIADFLTNYTQTVVNQVMRERFSNILKKPNSPFTEAFAADGDYLVAKTKGAWTSTAKVKPEELRRGMNALAIETERIKRFGITDAEYERARTKIVKQYETLYNEREKQQNSSYANEYVKHFIIGECISGIESEYEIIKQLAPHLPLDGINSYIKGLFPPEGKGKNVVISLTGPDRPGITYPDDEDLLIMYLKATEQYVSASADDDVIDKKLISKLPKPGKIIEEKEDPKFGATLFTLSNGVRVVVKKTDYQKDQKDEILMTAKSPGGMSLFKDEKDIWNLKMVNSVITLGGLGDLNAADVGKILSGKQVSVAMILGDETESINGNVEPSELKTFFELIYLAFNGIRIDDEAYSSFAKNSISQLTNAAPDPEIVLGDSIASALYNKNPRKQRLKAADFEKIDYHRMIEMYKERYSDASDFLFTFTGDIDKETIRPYLEQYLATLPALNRKEAADESMVTPFQKGKITRHFTQKMETSKTTVYLQYLGKMPYNMKNAVISHLLNAILELTYYEKVSGYESDSFRVMSSVYLYQFPKGNTLILAGFNTDPEKKDKILNIVKTELQRIAEEGPAERYLTTGREYLIKSRTTALKTNAYWLNTLDTYYYRNIDGHTDYEKTLQSITAADIKEFTKTVLNQGNELEVVMSPSEP